MQWPLVRRKEEKMIWILDAIVFAYLAARFFYLADGIGWCFEKIAALTCFAFAIPPLFVWVIVKSPVFLLLPLVFIFVAIDLISVKTESEAIS